MTRQTLLVIGVGIAQREDLHGPYSNHSSRVGNFYFLVEYLYNPKPFPKVNLKFSRIQEKSGGAFGGLVRVEYRWSLFVGVGPWPQGSSRIWSSFRIVDTGLAV